MWDKFRKGFHFKMLDQVRPQINHLFARLDAGEVVRGAQPIRRVAAPAVAAGLSVAQLAYDLKQAPNGEMKRKVFIRDILVLGGILAGLAGAGILLRRMFKPSHLHLPGIAHNHHHGAVTPFEKFMESAGKKLKELVPFLKGKGGHAHNHANEGSKAVARVTSLFKSPKCDHGVEGATRLQTLAAGGILGGALGGILGDTVNGENIGKTAPVKLKEGLFQYIGNITFCTLSILAFGILGKKAAQKILGGEGSALTQKLADKTKTLLGKLGEKEIGHLQTVPGAASEAMETYLLMARKNPKELSHLISHAHSHTKGLDSLLKGLPKLKTGQKETDTFIEGMQRYIGEEFGDRLAEKSAKSFIKEVNEDLLPRLGKLFSEGKDAELRTAFREFYSRQIRDDLKLAAGDAHALTSIARDRFSIKSERVGIVGGLFAGVIGGAIASNKLNEFLTHTLNLPSGHKVNGLFSNHSHAHGWMEGKIGDRGIHWWDAILHLDDWPTALYIAGVHSVEAFINVLYGISGFLTGTAGTDYQGFKRVKTFFMPKHDHYSPLHRQHRLYHQFLQNEGIEPPHHYAY